MMENKLKPCPFCGGKVSISLSLDVDDFLWVITRGNGKDKCKCRVFMESEKFYGAGNAEKKALIEAWNRRANDGKSE